MTHEHLHRPDDSSHEPHWENNSLGSSSYDPYVNPKSNGNIEYGPNGQPIFSPQNQTEPHWAKNPTPSLLSRSPYFLGVKPRNPDIPVPKLGGDFLPVKPRNPNIPVPKLGEINPLGITDEKLNNLVAPGHAYRNETLAKVNQSDSATNPSNRKPTPASDSSTPEPIPGLPKEGGKPIPETVQKEYREKHGADLKQAKVFKVKDSVLDYIGADMITHGGNIYAKKSESTNPSNPKMQYELQNLTQHRDKKRSILRYSQNDNWLAEQRKKQSILEAARKAEAIRQKAEDDRKRREAKAAADKKAADDRKAADAKRKQDALAKPSETKEQVKQKYPTKRPREPVNGAELKASLAGKNAQKKPEEQKQKQEQLKKTVQAYPAIKNILHQPDLVKGAMALGTISPKLGADLLLGAKLLKPGDTFKSISPNKGDVLAFHHNVVKGSEKIAKQAIKSALPQQQKDNAAKHVLKQEGGHDLFKDFGNSVFNGARSFTENAKKTGTALFNGVSNFWMPPVAAAEGPSSQAQNNGSTGGASQKLDTKLVDGGINSVRGAQPLSAFANFRDGSISNRPFQLTPGLPGELDQNYRETRTPQQLEALNQQLDTRTPQEKLRDRFNQDATKTAQSILKANRDRLKTEQAKYTKDQNPNSAHWQQLWQMADRRREMSTAQSTLKEQKAALDQERVQASPPPGLYERDFRETAQASQKRIQSSAYYKRQVQIQSEAKDLQSQIDSLEQSKATLEFAHPAIRAVQGETGKKPQDLQEVLKRIPGEFDGVRGNIDQLSNDLKVNPSAVINLDSVVAQQLSQLRKDKSVTPEQVNQLEKSIKDEKEGKRRNELLTGLAGAGLTIGSFFIPGVGEVSMGAKAVQVMRVLGAGLSLYSASSALPDLMMLDKATQAQRGGAGKLTPQSEGEAQFNLYMGYTNLLLAGVDAGALKIGKKVVSSAGNAGLQIFSKLDRPILGKFLRSIELHKTGDAKGALAALKKLRSEVGEETFQKLEKIWQKNLRTEARLGEDVLTEYSKRVGTVKMELHPKYAKTIQKFQDAGFEVVSDGRAGLDVTEVIDKVTGLRTTRKILHVQENMRFLDLEHEYGHLQQLERLGNPPLHRVNKLSNGKEVNAAGNDLQGVITSKQNTVLEYHNRLKEYTQLKQRGASVELLKEHADGVLQWREAAKTKGGLGITNSSTRKWTQENLPDLFELEDQYKNIGGTLNESGINKVNGFGS
jgi:hypothetical protein